MNNPSNITTDSRNDLSIKDPDKFYGYYKTNEYFLNAFGSSMLNARDTIEDNFKGVSTIIYGRMKSENSFFAKVDKKMENETPNIFDVYAFKIIVSKVNRDYKSDNPQIESLQKRLRALDNKRREIIDNIKDEDKKQKMLNVVDTFISDTEEVLGDLVSIEITNFLTQDNSPYLESLNATNIAERNKDYNKPNGFLSHQRTIKLYPDPNNPEACCFVEFQCRSLQADIKAKANHEEFKIEKYGPEASSFPKESFDGCHNTDDFKALYEKSIPTYVYLSGNEAIRAPYFVNFIQFYSDYLFKAEVDENGNIIRDENGRKIYIHQDKLDKINEFSKGFKRNPSHTITFRGDTNSTPSGGPNGGPGDGEPDGGPGGGLSR